MSAAERARVRLLAVHSQLFAATNTSAIATATATATAPASASVAAATTAGAIATATAAPAPAAMPRKWPAFVKVSDEVAHALHNNLPVVALESTIISHGMPYPQNVQTAKAVEGVARANGVVPATIAILKGVIHVGLGESELETLGRLGHACTKCSRRDLAQIVATKGNGATTVAGTMFVAHMVGIHVFVTGGIGGVHRGAEETMDVSADLTELARTPVAVVCAGVKSILDIPKTLEFLETQGVAVIAYGQKRFPAFFTADSGVEAPATLNTAHDIAATIHANRVLRLESGTVVAVPVPAHQQAEAAVIEDATQKALNELREKKIGGRDVTPYLLSRVNELTGGKSLQSNIALIKNNCLIGSQIAVQLSALQRNSTATAAAVATASAAAPSHSTSAFSGVAIFGGINQDVLGCPASGIVMRTATSTPGRVQRQWGGVGRNIAECVARLGVGRPRLISAVGDDAPGHNAIAYCNSIGIDTRFVALRAGHVTSTYLAVLDERGDVFATIADMAVTDTLTPQSIDVSCLEGCGLVAIDGNVSADTISWLTAQCVGGGGSGSGSRSGSPIPVWFEPTSVVKSLRVVSSWKAGRVAVLSPNVHELQALAQAVGFTANANVTAAATGASATAVLSDSATESAAAAAQFEAMKAMIHALFAAVATPATATATATAPLRLHIVAKRGHRGVVLGTCVITHSQREVQFRVIPAAPLSAAVVNTSGAGDTLVGGCLAQIAALHSAAGGGGGGGFELSAEVMVCAVECGARAAAWKVVQSASVSPHISPQSVAVLRTTTSGSGSGSASGGV